MKVVRASDVEEEQRKRMNPVPPSPSYRPAPQPQPVSIPPDELSEADFDRMYQKRMDRMMKIKEMEMFGITPKSGGQPGVRQAAAPPLPPVDRKTELVKVANQMKDEYQALRDASAILGEFTKPNPWEMVINSEIGKGIGQVIGSAVVGVMNNVSLAAQQKQMEKAAVRQAKIQYEQQQQQPQRPMQPQQGMPQGIPQQQGVENQPMSQIPQEDQPPRRQDVNLRLDENDKRLMEQQQSSMVKITENLSQVINKIEELNRRMDGIEKSPDPSPQIPTVQSILPPGVPSKLPEGQPQYKYTPPPKTFVPPKEPEVKKKVDMTGFDDVFGKEKKLEDENIESKEEPVEEVEEETNEGG